jgi:hypothetical protein
MNSQQQTAKSACAGWGGQRHFEPDRQTHMHPLGGAAQTGYDEASISQKARIAGR